MNASLVNKILVIGGSGFIGRHLIEDLLASGFKVRSADIHASPIQHPNLESFEGSFVRYDAMEEAFEGCDVIFHLASTTLPKTSNDNPSFDVESNLLGALGLLKLALTHQAKKFIFISSGGTVYGPPQQLPVREEHTTDPICSYGVVKLSIEKYLRMYHSLYGLNCCSLRLANPYGEHQRFDSGQGAVTAFCHSAVHNKPILVYGDGSVIRDFIYIDDAVQAMKLAMQTDCCGEAINIGSGYGTSLNQLLTEIERACGHSVPREYQPGRNFDVPEIYLDINKAKELFDWQPKITLSEGIEKMVGFLKNQP